LAIVSLDRQRIHVYGRDGLVAESAVSTGQRGYRTPTGIFSVLQKRRHHESNIYSGAPMPWMHRLTWSGIALHGGVVPGYPASHGCIRLTYDFAPKLWAMSRVGVRVVIVPKEVIPQDITHPLLPAPIMTPAEPMVAHDGGASHANGVVEVSGDPATAAGQPQLIPTSAAVPRRLNPMERARLAKTKADAAAVATKKAAKPALELARRTAVQANKASAAMRRAQRALASAEARLTRAENAARRAKPQQARRLASAEASARGVLEKARRAAAEAQAAEAARTSEAEAAAAAAKVAVAANEAGAAAAKAAYLGLQPISLLVSRQDSRLYVRQGFNSLFDMPIGIREPSRPLGTHVFTATAAVEAGSALRWRVVTLPDAAGDLASSAAEALERIEFPAAAMEQVGARVWIGASLIVTDRTPSRETGPGTDFIVLTKP
jgi:hypothetical protein